MSSPASTDVSAIETRALSISLVATALLGGGAIVWGILSGSSVILTAASVSGRTSPSRTKSELGSKITTGSRVAFSNCSSTTPRA